MKAARKSYTAAGYGIRTPLWNTYAASQNARFFQKRTFSHVFGLASMYMLTDMLHHIDTIATAFPSH